MEYITALETAEKWGVSLRYVQTMCQKEKIPGTIRKGRDWMIPSDAVRPIDGRTKAGRAGQGETGNLVQPFPRRTPFLHMTDLYSKPGSAQESIERLANAPEAQLMLAAEIAYAQGDIDRVYESTIDLLNKRSGFYATLSSGMLLALCAIWKGDLIMWRRAKIHIAEAPAKTDADRDIIAFSITAVDSMLYDVSSFPEWFKIGRFEPLHRDSLPAVKVFYAKYLYTGAYAVATKEVEMEGVQGLSLMAMLPFAIEPMISQTMADNSVIAELYLRMICATVYHSSGDDEQAIWHIDRAIALALPDKLYGLLTEYCRLLGPLIQQRLMLVDPEAWEKVNYMFKGYMENWAKLSGSVRSRTIATTLSQKERQVARLAAFGLSNKEIADKLHISLSGVKQAVRIVSEKTGMRREEFAAIL